MMFEVQELMGSSVELVTKERNGEDDIVLTSFPDTTAPEWTVELLHINLTRYESETCPLYHSSMTLSKDIYEFACNEGAKGIRKIINAVESSLSVSEAITTFVGMPGKIPSGKKLIKKKRKSDNNIVEQFRREYGYDNIDDLLLLRTIFELQEMLGKSAVLSLYIHSYEFQGTDGLDSSIEVCDVALDRYSSDKSCGYHAVMEVTGDLYKFACKQGKDGIQKLMDVFSTGINISDSIMMVTMSLLEKELDQVQSHLGSRAALRL